MQWKYFHEIICCVIKNIKFVTKNFLQHGYYGSVFTTLYLHFSQKLVTKFKLTNFKSLKIHTKYLTEYCFSNEEYALYKRGMHPSYQIN